MGYPVLILGETGSGKSYGMKNFEPEQVSIFSVEKNRLPFKKRLPLLPNATYADIVKHLKEPRKLSYVIDDSQYLLVNEMFDKVKETGFQKWTELALNFRNLIHMINHDLPADVIVYFLHHTDTDAATGKTTAKTVGKLLSEKLTIEGCFDLVLLTQVQANEHIFITQSDGFSTAKSPEGMLPLQMPNDLCAVDKAIREYYGLKENNTGVKE